MIDSLRTPKRRVVLPDGTIFFSDFSDTLHVDMQGVQEPIGLNLGTSNWTVSETGEAAFLFRTDDAPCLAIVDPARHTRLFQPLRDRTLLDLILLERKFYAVIPGYLVSGVRQENGALSWKGMRALDCGAGFRIRLEDSGDLSYTRRGTYLRYRYDPDSRKVDSSFSLQRLWDILFRQAFAGDYRPALPEDGACSIPSLLLVLRREAAAHPLNDTGVRLYSLLSLLEREGAGTDTLLNLVGLDWKLQYSEGLDEPFPTLPLIQQLFQAEDPAALEPGKLYQKKVVRWSRQHEDDARLGRWSKPLNAAAYEDTVLEA